MYSVVVIDDSRIAVEAIVRSTDWAGCGCRVAGCAFDGAAGLRLIREQRPDIVVIDIQMPGFNGLEVIERLRLESKELQFIIVSGYNYFEYARQALRYEVSDYLLKPFMAEELEEALRSVVMKLRQSQAALYGKRDAAAGDGPGGEGPGGDPAGLKDGGLRLAADLSAVRGQAERYSPMVAAALVWVERNLGRNSTLAEICAELQVSTGHFSKRFKRETGIGFAAWVTMVKMERASKLLADPQNRVGEVARMLGYSDYAYFFQVFKKQFGYAPGALKAGTRKEKEENENGEDGQ